MVRVTYVLSRIPVIKFRKGGLGKLPVGASSSAPPQAAAQSYAASSQRMSTSSVPDIDLPLRYRRIPLSEEEIEHINGGGIV